MTNKILTILLLSSLLFPYQSGGNENEIEYTVYTDFIKQTRWDRLELYKIKSPSYVIHHVTHDLTISPDSKSPWIISDRVIKELPELQTSTIESFTKVNIQTSNLDASSFDKLNVILITDEEEKEYFGPDGTWWPGFYRTYPNSQGILTLSRVGISSDRKQALLYYHNQWDGKAGIWAIVLLYHDGTKWLIKKEIPLWAS
jgi:hypothetical protein